LSLLSLLLLLLLLVSLFLGLLLLAASGNTAGNGSNAGACTGVSSDGPNGSTTRGAFRSTFSSRALSGFGRVLALLGGLGVLAGWRRLNLG
jgi:hypothetical protein